jgi:Amt family ammonium transporter
MPEFSPVSAGLAFLVPLGFALVAAGGLPEERAREATLSVLAALGLACLGYVATGFALEFGGVGLTRSAAGVSGLEGLIWEWSAIGETWGAGWGMAGLAGWGLMKAAATSGAYALAITSLPWVMTAALIPLLTLRGRIPAWASALLALVMGAVLYPLAGNWIWGGGWLANLGGNLSLGHGFVDPGGAGLVHVLGAAAAGAGMLVFLRRKPAATRLEDPTPLPPVHLPLLAVVGALLLLVGLPAWILNNPLLHPAALDPVRLVLNLALAAAMGALVPLLYTWFVTGEADPLMAVRGMAAASVAIAAAGPFVAPFAALGLGAAMGLVTPLVIYAVDHLARVDDQAAVLTVHGLAGALGLLAVGLLADGSAGQGWNGIGATGYLGVARQGIAGLLAAEGFRVDFPAQLQAQAVGVVTLSFLGFFGAWLAIGPLMMLMRFAQPRSVVTPVSVVEPVAIVEEAGSADITRDAGGAELSSSEI